MSCIEKRSMMMECSLLSLILLLSSYVIPLFASPIASHLCRPDQRDVLLEFRSEFYVNSDGGPFIKRTEVWWRNNTDCCSWDGISCDPKTGNVIELLLRRGYLNGPLRSNSSLFRLLHLQVMDFSANNISGVLPNSIGNLRDLRLLSLMSCNFFGKIPSSLGNLSYLTDLDLYGNGFTGELPDSFSNLNRLTNLRLEDNKLNGSFPHVLLNLTSLTTTSLGYNQFDGMIPSNMSGLPQLQYFDIGGNSFSGSIPSSLFTIPSLRFLHLRSNHFSGSLEIGNISSSKLQSLHLGENNINWPTSEFLWKLVDFKDLDLAYLNTSDVVDLSVLSRLTSLEILDLSGNNLKISSALHLSPLIDTLRLSSCNIFEFPKFLQNQTRLISLDISANRIEGQVPEWLWSLPELQYVNISHNSFTGFQGPVGVVQRCGDLRMLDISSNRFHDPFPLLPNSVSSFLGSDNGFSEEIPLTICRLAGLGTLVLSNNNFSGSIPRCFQNFNTTLSILHLRNNSLSGVFPEESISISFLSVDVGDNKLSGRLPKSLANCIRLELLNLEHNRFNDSFPLWVRLLANLQMLVLRSNEFHGPISYPGANIRIFDVSDNRFNGVLPFDYFAGWNAISSVVDIVDRMWSFDQREYEKSVVVVNKGLAMELVWSSFAMYKVIDLSRNIFEGDIPESIGLLKGLIVLNMSNNAFTGRIPQSLANLTSLESLDLSHNALSARIPPELGKLTFLSRMNFSYNKLEGPIPQGTQIQSQDNSSFVGNLALCGVPLQEACGGKDEEATKEEEEEEEVISWIAAAIGYVPGVFCGLIIAHVLASSYKHDWFMKIFHSFS